MRKYDALVKRFSVKLEREDLQNAQLSAVIYNANGVGRKGGSKRPWNIDDFMGRKTKIMPWQQQLQVAEMLNKAFGGTDNRKVNG